MCEEFLPLRHRIVMAITPRGIDNPMLGEPAAVLRLRNNGPIDIRVRLDELFAMLLRQPLPLPDAAHLAFARILQAKPRMG
jgi:hypothetical protein